jgi:S-adenosyl-L-methionine hydrolase (adenosine-forming)
MLHPVSRTFHGRDVFAPAAAHLAAGVQLGELGPVLEPSALVRRDAIEHRLTGSALEATIQYVDRFGNLQLAISMEELGGLFVPGVIAEVGTPDDRYYVLCAETFADVAAGEFVMFEDSSGLLAIAINRGNAAELTATEVGDLLAIEFAPRVDAAALDR